jgi:hypothetical protein
MYAEVANVFFSTGQPIALEHQHRGRGMPPARSLTVAALPPVAPKSAVLLLCPMNRTMRRAGTAL